MTLYICSVGRLFVVERHMVRGVAEFLFTSLISPLLGQFRDDLASRYAITDFILG